MFLPKKIFLASVCSCLAVSTVIALPFALFTPSVQAQSRRVRYVPPSNLDAPKVSSAGATRTDPCSPRFMALVPYSPQPICQPDNASVRLTIAEHPTIYFQSPKFRGSVRFRLYEYKPASPSLKPIYDLKSIPVNSEAGIIALKIPDDAPILEIGKVYQWKFTVNDITEDTVLLGWVQRILPTKDLVTKLQTTSQPVERATLFAQEGLWFETVQTLAEAQLTLPKNMATLDEWTSLLKSANLDRVLSYSFVLQKQ
jgi:hypothetical protein